MTLKFDGWHRKTIGRLFNTMSSYVHHFKSIKFRGHTGPKNSPILTRIEWFRTVTPVWVHPWSYSPKPLNSGQNCRVLWSRVTSKFDGWPWKTIGYLFYTTSSLVHHFKAMGEFKLESQSGKAQFGSKSAIFCPVWPWNLADDLEKQ